jgi:O-antigen/teichoic acid export membrane protein
VTALTEDMDSSQTVIAPETASVESRPPGDQKRFSMRALFSSETAVNQGFLSLADQAVASITNFVTGVVIARSSSKEQFGLYMLGFSLVLFFTDLQTSMIATPFMVYAPRLKGEDHALYSGSTLIHQTIFSLLAMLALTGGACAAHWGVGPTGLEPVLWALASVIGLLVLREFVRRICFAGLMLSSVFIFDTVICAAQLGSLLLLSRLHLLVASTAYWIIGPVCGIASLVWLWLQRRSFRPRWRESISDFKRNWAFGRWVFASGLVYTASANLYAWFLALFHGTAAAAVFAACSGVVSASNPALLGIQNFLGPKTAHEFVNGGLPALRRFVLRISALVALPAGILTVALIVWGDQFVAMLYGHRYSGNGAIVAVLALNLFVSATGFSFSRALLAMERANVDFVLNLVSLIIMLTLGLWLVKAHSALGAAIALVCSNFATSLVKAGIFLLYPINDVSEQTAN